MSFRTNVLDAVIEGRLGKGLVVTRQAVIQLFNDAPDTYTRINSQIYNYFTQRVDVGTYRIHPQALLERMNERRVLNLTAM